MYKAIIAIGIAAAACLVAGCGSSGDATATAAVTKAEFIKQADAVCSKIAKEREAAITVWEKEYPGGADAAQEDVDDGLEKVISPSMQHEVEELEALEPPAQDGETIEKMIANLKKGSTVIADQGVAGIPKSGIPQYEKEAAKYGFKVCQNP